MQYQRIIVAEIKKKQRIVIDDSFVVQQVDLSLYFSQIKKHDD